MDKIVIKNLKDLDKYILGKRIFLVSNSIERYEEIAEYFRSFDIVRYEGITPNPKYEEVKKGVELFKRSSSDLIIAIGGGSVIDVAKCIKLFSKMDDNINYLEQEKIDTKIPLIAIPTTSGTGSEATKHAVIYYKGEKQSISHESIIPDISVLLPKTLITLPIYQKKCTMLDALCQAIESYWSVNSTDESKVYSIKAINLIKDNYKGYIFNGDLSSSEKIMDGSYYSGRAINITSTTAPHAMSYKLTSLFGLPHGHSVAISMKEVWKYTLNNMDKCIDRRGETYLRDTINSLPVDYFWYEKLLLELDMNYPISNNREDDIRLLSSSVNPLRLKNNPIELSLDTLKEMYMEIVK